MNQALFSLILVLAAAWFGTIFEIFFRRFGQRYLRLWALSWAMTAMHMSVDAADGMGPSPGPALLEVVRLLGITYHCLLLVWGLYEAGSGRRASPRVIRVAHVASIGISLVPLLPLAAPLFVASTLSTAATAIAYLGAGGFAAVWLGVRTVGAFAMVSALFLNGMLLAHRVLAGGVLHPLADLDLRINLLIEFFLAMGSIIWLLELASEQAVESAARVHRAQEASLRRFQRLLERGWDLVELRKPDGTLEWVSQSVERVLRIPARDYLSAPPFSHVHRHDRAALRRLLSGEATNMPVPLRMTDGGGVTRRMEAVAVDLTSDPAVRAIVVTSRDVSDRHRLQRELLDAGGRERRVLGRRLHDGLGQVLTGVGFKVAQLETLLERDPAAARSVAKDIKSLVRMAVTQAESLARGLSPVAHRVEGLASALESLSDLVRRRYGVECVVGPVATEGLDDELAGQLYLIAEEALYSIVGAHGAARAEVELRTWEDGGALIVRGLGCIDHPEESPESVVRNQMRARLMEYRASAIDAAVDPVLRVGDNRTIRCRFRTPLARGAGQEAG